MYIYIYIFIDIFMYIILGGWWDSPSPAANNFLIPHPLPSLPFLTKFLFPSHQKLIQLNKKIKMSFLAVVVAPVPFLFPFHTILTNTSC